MLAGKRDGGGGAPGSCCLLLLLLVTGPLYTSAFRRLRDELPTLLPLNTLEGQDNQEHFMTTLTSTQQHTTGPKTPVPTTPIEVSQEMSAEEPGPDTPLPRSVRPLHYLVRLQPFLNGNFSIHGFVEVEVEALESTTNITLHLADLRVIVNSVKLAAVGEVEDGHSAPTITHFTGHSGVHTFTAHLTKPLNPGRRYRYSMNFYSNLKNTDKGFYSVKYKDEDGGERSLAITKFPPSYARRAFPCFDEPHLKATFDIQLARENNMTSVSLMPLVDTSPLEGQEGWVVDSFLTTPHIPTHSLAFAVSSLAPARNTSLSGLPITVWARQGVLQHTTFLQEFTPRFLTFFEQYFNVSYPLTKLDVVIVPGNETQAISSPGLIVIYQEAAGMYDASSSTSSHKQHVAEVLAHEVSHQWLGNLVTPKTWSHIWLYEGLASYLDNVAVSSVESSWSLNNDQEEELVKDLQKALHKDSLSSSFPLYMPALNSEDIVDFLLNLVFQKGSSVVRMLRHCLSEKTFRTGLTNFIQRHKYDTAEQDDLWRHLTTAAHQDDTLPQDLTVKTIMDTWTLQMGYPVIKVERSPDGTSATVSQESFRLSQSEASNKWWVPLTYTVGDDPNFNETRAKVWMKDSETHITIPSLPTKDQWVIFNLQETGYYRVNYDQDNWNLLIQQLLTDHRVINTINRAQIIDDAMSLAGAGKLSYETALNVTKYLTKEKDAKVWDVVLTSLDHLNTMLANTAAYGGFKKYWLSVITPVYEKLSAAGKVPNSPWCYEVVKWACYFGHPRCVQDSQTLYRQFMEKPNATSLAPEGMLEVVYCTAIAHGGEEEWQFGWTQYLTSDDDHQKDQLLKGLACTKESWMKNRYLDMAFTPGVNIRNHDTFQVFSSVAAQVEGPPLAWEFILQNWENVTAMFGTEDSLVDVIVRTASKPFNTQYQLAELEVFLEEHQDQPSVVEASRKAIQQTANNVVWMDTNYHVISQWLHERGFSTRLQTL